jgi:hypothetical protein
MQTEVSLQKSVGKIQSQKPETSGTQRKFKIQSRRSRAERTGAWTDVWWRVATEVQHSKFGDSHSYGREKQISALLCENRATSTHALVPTQLVATRTRSGAHSPGVAGPKIGKRQESGTNRRPGAPENEIAMRKNTGRAEHRHGLTAINPTEQ